MKLRKFTLFLVVTILLTLASCKQDENGAEQGGQDILPNNSAINLVMNSDSATSESLNLLIEKITEETGVAVNSVTDGEKEVKGEIIVGRSERAVSKRAYQLLARLEYPTETAQGYLIYSDGNSIAIAYDDAFVGKRFAEEKAIDKFVEVCLTERGIDYSKGQKASEVFDALEVQKALDDIYKADEWEEAKAELGAMYGKENAETITQALQYFHSLFGDGVESWIANLYAPEIGGFYYSNSARNTKGFLPDIESTYFALNFLKSSGMMTSSETGNGYNYEDIFSEEFIGAITAWVKGLQDPENGYFYHPQWGKEFTDTLHSRKGRDLKFAISILKKFCNSNPTYDSPQGDKGDGILPDGTRINAVNEILPTNLTSRLSVDTCLAVSKLVATNAEDNVPAHLASAEAFYEYLEGLDVNGDSYSAGNTLESQASQLVYRDKVLKSRGEDYSLCQIMVEYLTEKQNKTTGLWTLDNEVTYEGVNGLLKIGNAIDGVGYPMPNMDKAVWSAIEAIRFTEPITVCYVLNPWYTLRTMYDNAKAYGVSAEVKAEMEKAKLYIVENADEFIRTTAHNTMKFQKPDGSFSFNEHMTTHLAQGALVAVQGTDEGDLNATNICVNAVLSGIYGTLGIHGVTVLSESKLLNFLYILNELTPAIKDLELVAEMIDFDDESLGQLPVSMSYTMNSTGTAEITQDFANKNNRYVKLVSKTDGAGKGPDAIVFERGKTLKPNANCYVWQVDMCYESGSDHSAQIVFGYNLYMLGIGIKNNKLYFMDETTTGSDSLLMEHGAPVVSLGEWFNLRVEYYKGTHDTVRIKIYVNDVLTAVTDNYFGKKLDEATKPNNTFSQMTFRIFSNKQGTVLFDNYLTYATNAPYEDPAKNEIPLNVDFEGTGEDRIYTFDENELPSNFKVDVADGDSVKTESGELILSANGITTIDIPINRKDKLVECTRFVTDLFVDESSSVGAKLKLDFMVNTYRTDRMLTLHLVVCEDANGKYLALHNANGDNTADAIAGIRLPLGQYFKLCIEFYAETNETIVFANDILTASTNKISASVDVENAISNLLISKIGDKYLSVKLDDLALELVHRTLEDAVTPDKDRVEYDFSENIGVVLEGGAQISGNRLVLTNGSGATFDVNERVEVAKTALLNLDIYHNAELSGVSYEISLLNGNKEVIAKLIFIGKDGNIFVYEEDDNGKYPNFCAELSLESFEYTLHFEYALIDEVINLYVLNSDGERQCIARTSALYSVDSKTPKYFKISSLSSSPLYIDDLYAETVFDSSDTNMNVEFDTPDFNENGVIDFEHSSVGKLPSNIVTYFTYGGNIDIIGEGVGDAVNKVLLFNSNGKDQITVNGFTREEKGYNAIAYEVRMNLTNKSGTSGKYYLIIANKEIAIRVAGGQIVIVDPGPNSQTHQTGIAPGEWFSLRIEYFKDPSTKTVGYVYKVNGSIIGYDITDYDYDSMKSASDITNIYFRGDSKQGIFTMLMDDIVLERFVFDYPDGLENKTEPSPEEPDVDPTDPAPKPENPEITSPDAPIAPGENYGDSEWT